MDEDTTFLLDKISFLELRIQNLEEKHASLYELVKINNELTKLTADKYQKLVELLVDAGGQLGAASCRIGRR